jgi:glycosyltransferase involved in cell wall biosynthesis
MKIAIAHDYLTQRGGAERVVLVMAKAFPDATIYTTLYDPEGTYPEFADRRIVTSWLNRIGPLRRHHHWALPLLAPASDSLAVDADVVIVSSSGWAHAFPTRGRRVVYCYSPARWLYQTPAYLGGSWWRSASGVILMVLRPFLRVWDGSRVRRAERSGGYFAISRVVRARIRETYGIESEVVPAPHSARADAPQDPVARLADWADIGYHLVVSRLLPYKNVEQVVEAFSGMPSERLVIVGRGPLWDRIQRSLPANVRLLGGLTDAQLAFVYAHCTTLIAPSFEDFGLTPLEAGVYGKPALALRAGGFLDTITEDVSGAYFDTPTPSNIAAAVASNKGRVWDPVAIAAAADAFSEARFIERLRAAVDAVTPS